MVNEKNIYYLPKCHRNKMKKFTFKMHKKKHE